MKSQKNTYYGLNIFRAIAVLMMILAHGARLQTNMNALHTTPSLAGFFDWPLVLMLIIEPIISAMFLFIAGFSLVLSLVSSKQTKKQWLKRLSSKMAVLYGISVIFYLADQGAQLPDLLASSGVLGIIAVGILSAGIALCTVRPVMVLGLLTMGTLTTAFILEQEKLDIVGLNAGAGGMVPLIAMAYLGSLVGLVWQRWQSNGLWLLLGASAVLSIFVLLTSHPWVTHPASAITYYSADRVAAVWFSIQDLFGLYDGQPKTTIVRYWNHSWVFALRVLPLLLLGTLISLNTFKKIRHPLIGYVNWLGTQALNLYILHLLLLALVEVSGLKPDTGWQTLLILVAVIGLSSWLLRYVSFVPLRVHIDELKKPRKAGLEG